MNRRVKISILMILILILLYITGEGALMTKRAYSDYVVNRLNVQERQYESLSMLFSYAQILIFSFSLLALSGYALFRAIRPSRGPGKVGVFFRRNGLYLAVGFLILFVVLFVLDRAAIGRIRNTVETSEVPAALRDRMLSSHLQIGAELAAEGSILSLVPWLRNRKRSQHEL